jgi:hypothetical protein
MKCNKCLQREREEINPANYPEGITYIGRCDEFDGEMIILEWFNVPDGFLVAKGAQFDCNEGCYEVDFFGEFYKVVDGELVYKQKTPPQELIDNYFLSASFELLDRAQMNLRGVSTETNESLAQDINYFLAEEWDYE